MKTTIFNSNSIIRKILLTLTLSILIAFTFAQSANGLSERLQGISSNGVAYLNSDGIEIMAQTKNTAFNTKNIVSQFKQFKIKEKQLISYDSILGIPSYYYSSTEEKPKGVMYHVSHYFFESNNKQLSAAVFSSPDKPSVELEQELIDLYRNNKMPQNVFNPMTADSVRFADRKIAMGNGCRWMGPNNLQCPSNGQMNWSAHSSLEGATQSINDQFKRVRAGNKGKITTDTTVNIVFEGQETTARKIVYDFTGVSGALVGMSGGKYLTIYFVAAPVRNTFLSCVMSFWNNDRISTTGLTTLLDQVMVLK